MNPISPSSARRYPCVYDTAWHARHSSPESEATRRHRSVERQVFASFYEVPRQPEGPSVVQPSTSSAWPERRFPKRHISRSSSASNVNTRDPVKHSAENKNKKPVRHESRKPDSVIHDLNNDDATFPTSSQTTTKDPSFFQFVIQAVNDIKLSSDKALAMNILPEFDSLDKGLTVDDWIKKVELCREVCDWSERQTNCYAILKLTGQAKTWYRGLQSTVTTWEGLKRKLIEAFPANQNYAELLSEMLSLKVEVGECVVLYYHEKINLIHRCNISGKEAVDCLLHGVKDKVIRLSAQAAQFTEPHLLLKFFRTVKLTDEMGRAG